MEQQPADATAAAFPLVQSLPTSLTACDATLKAMARAGSAPVIGYHALTSEWLSFMQNRVRENIEAGKELASCRTVDGALRVQMAFTQSSFEACVDEAKQLFDLAMKTYADGYMPSGRQLEGPASA